MARSTIYDYMRRGLIPNIGQLANLSDDDFKRHLDDCKGDLQQVADRLRASVRAVKLRVNRKL
jgi:hypothetical protein